MAKLFDFQRMLTRNSSRSMAPWYLSLAAAGLLTWQAAPAFGQEFTPPEPEPLSTQFVIQDATQPPAAQPPTLPDTTVQGQQPSTAVNPEAFENGDLTGTILDGTIFSNSPTIGYRADTSTAGSIIAIPNADLPMTVNTITRDALDDQIAIHTSDIFRNAGGIVAQGDSQFADRFLIRGQQIQSSSFRKDGFLDRTGVPRDYQNVERVEILKGPASVLYGAGDSAGVINLVTKKPVYDQFAIGGYTFGSWGQDRFTLDANNYTAGGNVLFRLNAVQESVNSFVDFDYINRVQIAPVVTFLLNDQTTLTWNGEYHKDHRIGYQGVPAVNGDPLALPPSRYVGEPANDFFRGEEFRQSLVLNHQINDEWYFRIGGYSLFTSLPSSTTSATSFAPAIPDPPAPFVNRLRSDSPINNEQTQSMIANLGGEFWTGDMLHKAVFGLEYNYLDSNSIFNAGLPIGAFDPSNPVYNNPPAFPLFGLQTNAFRQQRVGYYMQDLVELTANWKAMGGVRFDTADFQFDRVVSGVPGGPFPLETNQTFNRVTPRGGLVYQPWADESLSLYYTYAQSFSPPGGGAYLSFGPLNPVLGETHEAGIKSLITDGVTVTACGFHTVRQNDTFVLTPSVVTQVGDVTSQGAELNIIGNITDDWSLIANYTYCDARVNDVTLGLNNVEARNNPLNSANIWSRYNFYNDGYQTYGAALGWVFVGERPSDLFPNPIDLPSYSRWDMGLYYRRGQLNATVYLENIGDIQYATGSSNTFQIYQGAPFNGRANITYMF
ncbi:TonB-dependent receptor [Anatilimnocola floriformis]|uniref:TonB-dependent receptor n=1 Tax=Anatilimnocola floriformis TaxID=2948575 RepID=UPI0020C1E51E|nr:TonB-dependent siderophore receptor [Anatilimnocola floriformis]